MSITSNREELRKIEYVVARKTGDLAVLKTVFPKHVQIGISDDEFRSSLTVEGTGTFLTAISGSLQTLVDGTDYLRAGTNIEVNNNLDGSITISAGSGFSGNTTNPITAGDGISFGSGTTFDGSSSRTVSADFNSSAGLKIVGGKLTVDPAVAADKASPHGDDYVLIGDHTDNSTKRAKVSALGSSINNSVNLQNYLTAGDGLGYTSNRSGYNNQFAETININLSSDSGLTISNDALSILPTNATEKASPTTSDVVLISDMAAGGVLKKATVGSLGLASSTLNNSLSVGDGLEFDSGTSYNNSASREIKLKVDGSTLSISSTGVSVSKVPNSLASGFGISSLSFDGSSSASVSIDTSVVATFTDSGTFDSSTNITFSGNIYGKFNEVSPGTPHLIAGSGIQISSPNSSGQVTITNNGQINIGGLSSGVIDRDDVVVFEQETAGTPSGNQYKTTISQILDLVDRTSLLTADNSISTSYSGFSNPVQIGVRLSGDTITLDSSGLKVTKLPSSISNSTGIKPFTFDGSSATTVEVDNSVVATLTGSNFTGRVVFEQGLTGSLQTLPSGIPYIIGGSGIDVVTGSDGQVIITNTGASGGSGAISGSADITSVSAGVGLIGGGESGDVTLNVDYVGPDSIVMAAEDGTSTIVDISTDKILVHDADTGRTKYININQISGLGGGGGSGSSFTAGDGLDLSQSEFSLDLKDGSGLVIDNTELSIDNSIIATISGSRFTGNVIAAGGLSGSLQNLADGTSYLREGSGISIVSGSNGAVTISSDRSIGDAEDDDYTDGLFTDFTKSTPVGTPIDRFNEILKLLVPPPAPELDDIDINSDGVDARLSFGTNNDQSSATPAYSNVEDSAGFGAIVGVNGDYSTLGTPGNSANLRAAVYDGTQDLVGDLNEDVLVNTTSPSNETNYVANSFGDADLGSLILELNGVEIYTLDLTNNSVGAGEPGSGTANYLNSSGEYEGSGFINVSIAKPGTFDNGTSFENFKHRTGQWKVAATGTVGQRNGWNYVRVKHVRGSITKVTNYVEWVKDSDSNALETSGNSLDFTGSGALQISGVTYNTGGTAQYQVNVSNAYRYVYDTNDITFTTSVSGVNSGVSYTIGNIAKPEIGPGEDHLKQISIDETDDISASYVLGGGITSGVNVTHPLKQDLDNEGQSTVEGLLIYNVVESSDATTENFQREGFRMQANDFADQTDVTGGSYDWDSSQNLLGSSAGHNTGLQVYRERLYSPKNTLNSGDFRNSVDGGSLENGPAGNPDYSGASGTKTFYRKFQNSGSSKRDFSYTMQGDATLVAHGGTLGANKNFKLYFKIPSDGSGNTTGWLDAATGFTYGDTSNYAGGSIGAVDNSVPISAPNQNNVSFGTVEIGNNEYIIARIEADADWTGYLDNFAVTFGAVGSVSAAPNVNDIDCNQNGVNAKLSFGDDLPKANYIDVSTGAGFSAVNENELYSSSGNRKAVFNGSQVISGDINETVAANGNNHPANAFGGGNANKGSLKLELNGAIIHTTNLESFASGDDLTSSSGFINLSAATPGEDNNGLPDFTKFYRTGQYQVASGTTQRNGWNYVRVIHTVDGVDSASDYVEWVNDDSNQNITFSGVSVGNFSSSSTYKSSGVSYYVNPTGRFDYTASNVYKYVYSPESDALSYPTTTNCTVSSVHVSGDGVSDGSVGGSFRSLPDLDNTVLDSYDDDITVQATFSYSGTSIPGESEEMVTLVGRVHHPLISQGGNIDTSSTQSAVILAASFNDNSTALVERFNGEAKRMKAGTTAYDTQASVSGNSNNWNSDIDMNGSDAAHNTGLIVYNGKLKSPQKVGLSGDLGDFRDQSEGGQLVAPSGNPDYSSLNNSTREYIRWFQNTTGGSKTDFNLEIQGSGAIVSNSTSLANSNKFQVFAKIPNANSDQTTGWMDTALPFETGQNGDNAGAMVGSLTSSLNATNRVTFGTKFVQNNEYILIKIVADKTWTGNLSKIEVSWI